MNRLCDRQQMKYQKVMHLSMAHHNGLMHSPFNLTKFNKNPSFLRLLFEMVSITRFG